MLRVACPTARRSLASSGLSSLHGQTRGIRLFEILTKEGREERERELREDLQRGYFDDFREFRDKQGKIFAGQAYAPGKAPVFPQIQGEAPDGSPVSLPLPPDQANVTLVAVAFRAGAQDIIESWAVPYSEALHAEPKAALVELAVIESVVMRAWPFRQLLLRGADASQAKYKLKAGYIYHFGPPKPIAKAMGLTNRLTGYIFLVDSQDRIRWRGSGPATADELSAFLQTAQGLARGTSLDPPPSPQARQ